MQLKHLKISGFKSFADPTVLDFPSELVAVVGPNGCGKSNIIDAIRWVLGESSARQLRGESMEDVIFNGSSQRKPVGQASVEMVFDNSLARFAGPYASYNEISIRRVVTRDGNSSWYLNGTRCRRKDILDLFSGTGARGYSIISQGEISRLIEAKPEVLRGHLEEAAGVSLYRERRKETLSRMERTRENLARVADIREELDRQLQRLEKQAKAAEKYLALKQEEKYSRAAILGLKQRDLMLQQSILQDQMQILTKAHEQQTLENLAYSTEKDVLQEQSQQLQIELQQLQTVFYESGLTIARLQENLLQQQKEKHRLTQEEQQIKADMQTAQIQKETCQESLTQALEQTRLLQDRIQNLETECTVLDAQTARAIVEKEAVDNVWQTTRNACNQQSSDIHTLQLTMDNSQQRYQEIMAKLEKLHREKETLPTDKLLEEAQKMQKEHGILLQEFETLQAQLLDNEKQNTDKRTQLQSIEKQLRQEEDTFRQIKTEHAVLKAAQTAAIQPQHSASLPFFADRPRLIDILQVEKDWQFAVECVLGDVLKALVVDSCEVFFAEMPACNAKETIVTLAEKKSSSGLVGKILGPMPAWPALDSIHTALTLEEALQILSALQEHESVITQQGYWLGKGWIRIPAKASEDMPGLLVQQQKILSMEATLPDLEQSIVQLRLQRDQLYENLQLMEKKILSQRDASRHIKEDIRRLEQNLDANQEKQAYTLTRIQNLEAESLYLQDSMEALLATKSSAEQQWETLQVSHRQLKETLIQHETERLHLTEAAANLQTLREAAKNNLHDLLRASDRSKHQQEQAQEGMIRESQRLIDLQDRLENILLEQEKIESGLHETANNLASFSARHQTMDKHLQTVKTRQTALQESLTALEKKIKHGITQIQTLENDIAQKRLDDQTLAVRMAGLEENLVEQGFSLEALLGTLDNSMTLQKQEEILLHIMQDISKLGAINLAAVEECRETMARKENLDTQYHDLEEALQMLTVAIEKMDEETRTRLSDTFDQINDLFKALFPRLFGGGKAALQWTSGNVLEAGVIVMAQPPGKRNSSIQLLSGGEKAMTAIALVFAIFQLNPSPFCMLDEVDAPLDEINVSRFCNVVKEMSEFVQFLFITHNKTTMEMAKQLIGVTMREPGISRLVTVDIKQALTLE